MGGNLMSTCNCSRLDRDCEKCRETTKIVEKQWDKFKKELDRPAKIIPELKRLFKNGRELFDESGKDKY